MKFFIKRKNKNIIPILLRSALLMVLAFGVYGQKISAADKKEAEKPKETADSVFTARKIFEKLHVSALDLLPVTTRLDMLDYWDVDSVYKASNAMDGLSWLENVTPDYLKVRITSVSTFELKILPYKKNEKLLLTIYTVGDDVQAQDSGLKFYDEQLIELPTEKFIDYPQVKDFFEIPKGSATKMREIEDMIPFPTVAFTAEPGSDDLKARLTVEKYINQDDWNIAKLFYLPEITLNWHKDKFKAEKHK